MQELGSVSCSATHSCAWANSLSASSPLSKTQSITTQVFLIPGSVKREKKLCAHTQGVRYLCNDLLSQCVNTAQDLETISERIPKAISLQTLHTCQVQTPKLIHEHSGTSLSPWGLTVILTLASLPARVWLRSIHPILTKTLVKKGLASFIWHQSNVENEISVAFTQSHRLRDIHGIWKAKALLIFF